MFRIEVHLVHGVYEATSSEAPGTPEWGMAEWPPHPARLFSAMLAVADSAEDLAALDWLESLGPPTIHASGSWVSSRRSNFVVTNELARGKAHMEFLARSGTGKRTWPRVVPREDRISFCWVADAASFATSLSAMARRLPYLGRSTTPVVATFMDGEPEVPLGDSWVPDARGTVDVTVPSQGFREALTAAYETDSQPWTVSRVWCRYRSPLDQPSAERTQVWPSAYDELIVFGIDGRSKPAWQSVARATTAFRKAVISNLGSIGRDPGPVELHGHSREGDAPPRHQVMFLGLPFVGSEHADGHLLGFGVCVPAAMSSADRATLYRGLLEVRELFGSGLPRLTLTRGRSSTKTLDPLRWCRPSKTWVSAYPIVLDRHISRDDEVEGLLRSACRHLDLPDPTSIDWSRDGLLRGVDRMRPNQLVRRRGELARPAVHARITFAAPVAGPVVLGNMRNLGLGLMLPLEAVAP